MKAIKFAIGIILIAIPFAGVGCGGVDGQDVAEDTAAPSQEAVGTNTAELRRDRDDNDRDDRDRHDNDRDRDDRYHHDHDGDHHDHYREWVCVARNQCGGFGRAESYNEWQARGQAQRECSFDRSHGWCRSFCQVQCWQEGRH